MLTHADAGASSNTRRKSHSGGSRVRDKKKNGLAVYEGNLILTAYMESLGKDFWQGTRKSLSKTSY